MYDVGVARDLAARIPRPAWSSCRERAHCPGRASTGWSTRSKSSSRAHGRRRSQIASSPRSSSRTSSGRRRRLGRSATRPGHGSSSSITRWCGRSSVATRARRSTPPATASSRSSTGRRARAARAAFACALGAGHPDPRRLAHRRGGTCSRREAAGHRGQRRSSRVRSCRRQVLVTSTIRDLVAGSGLDFEDRGEHELKGLDESRRVYVARGD